MKLGVSLEAGEAEDGERLKLRRWSVAGGGANAVDCPRERRAKLDVCSYPGAMASVTSHDCITFQKSKTSRSQEETKASFAGSFLQEMVYL